MKQPKTQVFSWLLGVAALLTPMSLHAAEGWVTNFEEAKKTAEKENKDLLTLFTGSDWCPPCMAMEKAIFSKEEFQKAASEDFVLVFLDFPRQKELSEEIKTQNEGLSATYGISAFPTVVFMDSSGKPYAMDQGGLRMEVPEYLEHLDEVQKKGDEISSALKAASEAEGAAAANKMTEALQLVPEESLSFYQEEMARLKELDPEDKSGFVKTQEARQAAATLEQEMGALYQGQKFDAMVEKIDAFVAKHEPAGEMKQKIMMGKVAARMEQKKFDEAIATVEEIIKEDPESQIGQYMAQALPQIKAEAAAASE